MFLVQLPGIPIQITLEDSSIAGATNYPDGRHSIYLGTLRYK